MECNGFNSDNYRYFKVINEIKWDTCSNYSFIENGDIVKISDNEIKYGILNLNFYNRVKELVNDWEIKLYPNEEPFDFFKFISMQDPIVFKNTDVVPLIVDNCDFCYINDWLKNKINSDIVPRWTMYGGARTIKEINNKELSALYDSEKYLLKSNRNLLESSEEIFNNFLRNLEPVKKGEEFNLFSSGQTVRFQIPVEQNEEWFLKNPSILLSLLDQNLLKLLANSEEILGKEKDELFYKEHKDNIPNTNKRYYKINDGIDIYNKWNLRSETPTRNVGNGFDPFITRMTGDVEFYYYNPNNYSDAGLIKYFCVEYKGYSDDSIMEKEILKISTRLSQEEAIEKHKEDLEAYKRYLKNKEALEYVKKYKNKYQKSANRNMTPLEFMESEQAKEKQYLGKRLIKTLNNQINGLNNKDLRK